MNPSKLALEDGTVYSGFAFGAEGEAFGEVVFNTSMTGYQEILTDPSYKGQIVTMTYPLIGNYGVNSEDAESARAHVRGFVVRELSRRASNFRATGSLSDYLAANGIIGITGIDTRALVRRIRIRGAMRGVLSTVDSDDQSLVQKAAASPGLVGRDLVREVVPQSPITWNKGLHCRFAPPRTRDDQPKGQSPHVVAMDFGMKWNIARHLVDRGCRLTVVPGTASACEVLAFEPDGVFLSNGPGDPSPLPYAIGAIGELIRHTERTGMPIFGICLGHQLLGLAFGGKTFKLKFGHRGANQPVINKLTGRVEITTQNHGFAVDPESLPEGLQCTHFNLNDQTLEGMRHRELPVLAVQYHPEASAGPHDSCYLFGEFRKLLAQAGSA